MFYVRNMGMLSYTTWACFLNNIRCFIMINLSNYIQWFLIKAQYDFATFTLQAYNITTIKESKGTIKEKDIVV